MTVQAHKGRGSVPKAKGGAGDIAGPSETRAPGLHSAAVGVPEQERESQDSSPGALNMLPRRLRPGLAGGAEVRLHPETGLLSALGSKQKARQDWGEGVTGQG